MCSCHQVLHLLKNIVELKWINISLISFRLCFPQLYSALDLEEFQKIFSAYQKPVLEENEDDHKNSSKAKTQVLTVVDGRRSQNCYILLSKLKLTNAEIAKAVLNVDEGEDLPKDMVEQVILVLTLFWSDLVNQTDIFQV